MYRVMMIDDEIAIVKLLTKMIDWETLDMEVVGFASSGIEAINVIEDMMPDICFVDVQMPFMNGIEFSRIARERYPKLKIIMLSAFDTFDYARECISIGVFDYRLKPIEKADITKTLRRLRECLAEEEKDDALRSVEEKEMEEKTLRKNDTNKSSDRVRRYIDLHYSIVDLNLTKVALEFGFNSSYLSRKFKNDVGCSFTDYLFRCRMEHAKLAAASGKPMYQIATETGVPDPNYFSKCFKRYVGVTYSEYIVSRQTSLE